MASETVLITGATGFLGSHLVKKFVKEQYNVIILKRSSSDIWRIKDVFNELKFYDVDSENVQLAFQENNVDVVIHTACNYGRSDETITEIVETNVLLGLEILENSIKFNTDTFFNTDTLLQKHLNVYTRSKKQFVEWLQLKSEEIQVINMKLEHMYGPGDSTTKFVPWVISQLHDKVQKIKLTKGKQKRDFIYVEDVVSAFETVLNKRSQLSGFSVFDVGTGELITLKEFVEMIKAVFESIEGPSKTRLDFGAKPYRDGEMMSVDVNNKKLLELGWKPSINIEKGLKKMMLK